MAGLGCDEEAELKAMSGVTTSDSKSADEDSAEGFARKPGIPVIQPESADDVVGDDGAGGLETKYALRVLYRAATRVRSF